MTFFRASASCAPSNFGTPTRLGAASVTVEKSAPSSSAKTPIETRRAFVVTRPEFRLRKDSFTRSLTGRRVVAGIALLVLAGPAGAATRKSTAATAIAQPRIIFDRTSSFGRVLVID